MRRDRLAAAQGRPGSVSHHSEIRCQKSWRDGFRSALVKHLPDIPEKLHPETFVLTGTRGRQGNGGSSRSLRPFPAGQIGNGNERTPVVLRPVGEGIREMRIGEP